MSLSARALGLDPLAPASSSDASNFQLLGEMEEGLLNKDGAPQNLYDAYCKYNGTPFAMAKRTGFKQQERDKQAFSSALQRAEDAQAKKEHVHKLAPMADETAQPPGPTLILKKKKKKKDPKSKPKKKPTAPDEQAEGGPAGGAVAQGFADPAGETALPGLCMEYADSDDSQQLS
eukprot:gene10552-1920_t